MENLRIRSIEYTKRVDYYQFNGMTARETEEILSFFERAGTNCLEVNMVNNGRSQFSLYITVTTPVNDISSLQNRNGFSVFNSFSSIRIAGSGTRGSDGLASKILKAFEQRGINIATINSGAIEYEIFTAVPQGWSDYRPSLDFTTAEDESGDAKF